MSLSRTAVVAISLLLPGCLDKRLVQIHDEVRTELNLTSFELLSLRLKQGFGSQVTDQDLAKLQISLDHAKDHLNMKDVK